LLSCCYMLFNSFLLCRSPILYFSFGALYCFLVVSYCFCLFEYFNLGVVLPLFSSSASYLAHYLFSNALRYLSSPAQHSASAFSLGLRTFHFEFYTTSPTSIAFLHSHTPHHTLSQTLSILHSSTIVFSGAYFNILFYCAAPIIVLFSTSGIILAQQHYVFNPSTIILSHNTIPALCFIFRVSIVFLAHSHIMFLFSTIPNFSTIIFLCSYLRHHIFKQLRIVIRYRHHHILG